MEKSPLWHRGWSLVLGVIWKMTGCEREGDVRRSFLTLWFMVRTLNLEDIRAQTSLTVIRQVSDTSCSRPVTLTGSEIKAVWWRGVLRGPQGLVVCHVITALSVWLLTVVYWMKTIIIKTTSSMLEVFCKAVNLLSLWSGRLDWILFKYEKTSINSLTCQWKVEMSLCVASVVVCSLNISVIRQTARG